MLSFTLNIFILKRRYLLRQKENKPVAEEPPRLLKEQQEDSEAAADKEAALERYLVQGWMGAVELELLLFCWGQSKPQIITHKVQL